MSLQKIQERLVCGKSQFNSFGNYKYRNLEDILNAVKPLLAEFNYSIIIKDDIVEVGGRVYVKATASIYVSGSVDTNQDKLYPIVENTAFAREPESRKGMDEAQITGATSSYARKYCLNGLFAIDDTKDADSEKPPTTTPPKNKPFVPPPDEPETELLKLRKEIGKKCTANKLTKGQAQLFKIWYITNYQDDAEQDELTIDGAKELNKSFTDLLNNYNEFEEQKKGVVK